MRTISGLVMGRILLCLAPATSALTEQERATFAVHERVARSVVLVLVWGTEVRVNGSGFAVKPGLIITNYHVIERASRIELPEMDH